ncbi:MAG TPA: hypothetical protein VE057_21605 [Archangium sp.]|nr:hypothetical protein [Archangium sp.]
MGGWVYIYGLGLCADAYLMLGQVLALERLGQLHLSGAQHQRPPSAALLGPSAPALTLNRPPIRPMR